MMMMMTFPKCISPKLNVRAQLEFELAFYDVIGQHIAVIFQLNILKSVNYNHLFTLALSVWAAE